MAKSNSFDPKIILYMAIFIVVIVIAIYFIKKNNLVAPPPVTLPNDINPEADSQGNFNPTPYTDALYNEIYASWYKARDVTPYDNALQLSNSELAAVDNDWNQRYFSKDGEKLSQAIDNEYTSFFSNSFPFIKTQLVAKLQKLEGLS
jgi:hypothetical protein